MINMIVYAHLLRMTLSLILSFFFVIPTLQEVSPVQTNVGSDANFSFMLTEDPNAALVHIRNKFGAGVLSAIGNRSTSSNEFDKDRVNFIGNTNQKLIFILRNVTLHDSGIYVAVLLFDNSRIIGSQMLIVKATPSKPLIVELEGHAVNGTKYHLNCSAQSNSQPPNHNLSMFSEWRKDDMLIHSSGRYIVNGTELTINGVSYKEDNVSTLTCVAFEDQLSKSVNSDKFIMDVKYGPDNIQLNPSDGIITERENGKIVVNCKADCNPPCSFKWTKDLVPTPLSNNQTLIITSVSKSDTGRYLCNVSNSITGISLTASINVMMISITPDSSYCIRTFPLPAVAGGLGAGAVVILLAVVALFLWRRYHHRSQHTDDIKQDDKERSRPVSGTQRNQINANSVRHDSADRLDYEGLHINNTEASAYLQLNDITLEENRYANTRPPENDSYEKLHPYTNTDIQMYSSLKIPKVSKDSEKVYENTQIKATNFNC